jgi:hypothetical protein
MAAVEGRTKGADTCRSISLPPRQNSISHTPAVPSSFRHDPIADPHQPPRTVVRITSHTYDRSKTQAPHRSRRKGVEHKQARRLPWQES